MTKEEMRTLAVEMYETSNTMAEYVQKMLDAYNTMSNEEQLDFAEISKQVFLEFPEEKQRELKAKIQ